MALKPGAEAPKVNITIEGEEVDPDAEPEEDEQTASKKSSKAGTIERVS